MSSNVGSLINICDRENANNFSGEKSIIFGF